MWKVSKRFSSPNTYRGVGDTLDWTPGSLVDIVRKQEEKLLTSKLIGFHMED